MGKYGIGERVTDVSGDLATIIGKRKGERQLQFDNPDYTVGAWFPKDWLTPVAANDNISAEKGDIAFSGEEKAWSPKVGDRVNWTRVRGEYDGSTVEAHDGFLYDFKLRATNGNHTYAFAHELEPAPLTIEAGKSYRTRDGRKVGPMVPWHGFSQYPFSVEHEFETTYGKAWRVDGTFDPYEVESVADLVAEWVEPLPEPVAVAEATATPERKWEPTIGDRVRVVRAGADFKEKQIGVEFTITNEDTVWDGERSWYSRRGETAGGWRYKTSELEPVIASEPKFKVGDIVDYGTETDAWNGTVITEVRPRPTGQHYYVGRHPVEGEGGFDENQIRLSAPKFKVGDRVGISAEDPNPGTVTGYIGGEVSVTWDKQESWYRKTFGEAELVLLPAIHIGSTVTFTATGRLSAINENGHYQVTFPGLEPGQNSFALPAKYVSLAN